jgi:CRISPR-associated protein Cas5h
LTLVIFDASSSFGYFRKSFTTTNSLSHNLIPRSTVEGLIGAILGLSSSEYPDLLQNSKIAVQILSEVRKINFKQKAIHPDWLATIPRYLENKPITKQVPFSVPVSIELLVNPKYRIFFDGGKINVDLANMLRSKKSHYTPYLGSSSMICSTRFVGEFEYGRSRKKEEVLSSVISFSDEIPKISLNNGTKFAIEEGLPIHIDKDRIPHGTYNAIYSPNAGKIPLSENEIYSVNIRNEIVNVKFLPTTIAS